MTAHMGCYLWHRHLVDPVILINDVLEVMLPVKRIHYASILIEVQESADTIHFRFFSGRITPFDNVPETILDILRHGQDSFTCTCLGILDVIAGLGTLLKLTLYMQTVLFKVDVINGKPTKLRNAKSGLKEDISQLPTKLTLVTKHLALIVRNNQIGFISPKELIRGISALVQDERFHLRKDFFKNESI